MLRMESAGRKVCEEEQEAYASECSSGCQSGWTMYFDDQPSNVSSSMNPLSCLNGSREEEQEEEDLSMVSDASSGPPHFHEEDFSCCNYYSNAAMVNSTAVGKKRRMEAEQLQRNNHNNEASFLDDTASSPIFTFSKQCSFSVTEMTEHPCEAHEFSSCFSATHFKTSPGLKNHQGHIQSSSPVKPRLKKMEEKEQKSKNDKR